MRGEIIGGYEAADAGPDPDGTEASVRSFTAVRLDPAATVAAVLSMDPAALVEVRGRAVPAGETTWGEYTKR